MRETVPVFIILFFEVTKGLSLYLTGKFLVETILSKSLLNLGSSTGVTLSLKENVTPSMTFSICSGGQLSTIAISFNKCDESFLFSRIVADNPHPSPTVNSSRNSSLVTARI